ncbi:substrate-binding domain-containing protein [Candidatus Nitronereus thalassa]|uniref:Substrate-binding domain-containing protein n=1 Tax=Candidatus Nitronereus thalassa TaxID=3020898 RepID=A0ABU3K509_9BACT|nr:substrate-binding domain-containing protein [Candidatus Nitronereus thalassa]MDT7041486.1 substrate-binding domain-containing protein [Candidatus Nitronereus thalassa]
MTSILALVLGNALAYSETQELTGRCLVIGNGPERYAIEALAKDFESLHPKTSLDFFWHQNARPVEEVRKGNAHIAITGMLEKDLPSTIVAWDGIAVITNFANPIEDISTAQLKQIFEGKLKFWSQVYEEGPEAKIRIFQRTWNQNIRQSFEQHINLENSKDSRVPVVEKEEHTFKAVNGDIYSISYVSMGPALQAHKDGYGVTLLFIDGIEPEYQTVLDGTYPLRRPVVFVQGKKPNPVAKAFLEFVLSPAGQRAVKAGASGLFQDRTSSVIKYYPLKNE